MPVDHTPPFPCWVPTDPDVPLTRYLSGEKFRDLLTRKALFFCRVDKLHDPYEGVLPEANRQLATLFGLRWIEPGSSRAENAFQFKKRILSRGRRHCLVNCWRLGSDETRDMWSLYAPTPESVMIVSSFSKLSQSFDASERTIYLSAVYYADAVVTPIDERNFYNAVTRKEPKYTFEQELRAITTALPDAGIAEAYWHDQFETGLHVSVDLRTLVQGLVLSPEANEGYRVGLAAQVDAAGLDVPIIPSSFRH